MSRYTGKCVMVTGGGAGLGRASALRFAAEGAAVAVVDVSEAAAQSVAAEIEALGARALPVRADVANPDDCQQMTAAVVSAFGRLDVLFCNAGVGGKNVPLIDLDIAEWDRLMSINLRGVFLSVKFAVPAIIAGGRGGAVVLMGSSTGGWDTIYGGGPYMASKEGVHALTRSLALELGQYDIRVNAVSPGIIQTQLSFKQSADDPAAWEAFFGRFARRIPLRRVGQPEDVAAAVAFLGSDEARHISGSLLLIDGGQTLQSWSNAPDADAFPKHQ